MLLKHSKFGQHVCKIYTNSLKKLSQEFKRNIVSLPEEGKYH